MKSNLIVFHSRTGFTRTVAETLARHIDADVEEIIAENQKDGLRAYLSAGWAALTRKPVPIKTPQRQARLYPLVIIGGPNWAGHISAPMLSWLDRQGTELENYAAFVTQGGSGAEKVLQQLEDEIGRAPAAILILTDDEIKADDYNAKIKTFARQLTG
ncbi:flavodoxin [Thalassovita gelatinovora]|uniref:Flavodoxin n=1 Tax=Thalassovita gelatinovora TaxID=53501 RepID=A0A0P1G527_THAGE|nr:flavodoxin family protein [Thalassovita gelatinovora]QIZ82364.1 flavodoxin family protein [Thalassovita gelatinovora]CUH68433.1 flavodoxin [Thalassovita gelatinovora]SEQ52016.1 Flavodoxin [Thalassovita gelatinovora]